MVDRSKTRRSVFLTHQRAKTLYQPPQFSIENKNSSRKRSEPAIHQLKYEREKSKLTVERNVDSANSSSKSSASEEIFASESTERSSSNENKTWIKSRQLYREATSRGSQTSTNDLGDSPVQDQHVAPNVRRASIILGDLRALYNTKNADSSCISLTNESRNSFAKSSWGVLFRDKILPELSIVCQCRMELEQKYTTLLQRKKWKTLSVCLSYWRSNIIRVLKSDLFSSIEKNNTAFYRQRKKNVIKVWSHIALGLNSKKKILERRHGGIERARESLTARLVERNDGTGLITQEMIQSEIRRMMNAQMSSWSRCYYQRVYFNIWRNHFLPHKEKMLLSHRTFCRKRCSAILSSWIKLVELSKAHIDHAENAFHLDYSRYAEALAFHRQKLVPLIFKKWRRYSVVNANSKRMRRRVLSGFARSYLVNWRFIKIQHIRANMKYVRLPFQCWREIISARKSHLKISERLVSVYVRSKNRRLLWSLFRRWKHQARYGKVTALYTRNELAYGWLEQKHKCEQQSSMIERMKENESSFGQLKYRIQGLEEQLILSETGRKKLEQDVLRLNALNESLSHLNPLAESLEALYPIFMHNNNAL